MLDTGDPVRDVVLTGLAGLVLVAALFALIPWGNGSAWRRVLTHVPLLSLPAYAAYEWLMPNHFDIRIDLLVLWPAVAMAVLIWGAKMLRRRFRGTTQM